MTISISAPVRLRSAGIADASASSASSSRRTANCAAVSSQDAGDPGGDHAVATPEELKTALSGTTVQREATLDGHPAALYLGQIRNYAGTPIAVLEVVKDTTAYEAAATSSQRNLMIGTAVILFGTDGRPTPTGRFTILEKKADYYSHNYHAPMPYMLRLTNDYVAIHGSDVRQGHATHGCIGVPLDFARLLFAAAGKGDLVVILPAQADAGKPASR